MNILIASVDFLPKHGGVSFLTHHVANGFSDIGLNVYVMSPFAETEQAQMAKYTYIQDKDSKIEYQSGDKWVASEKPRIISHLKAIIQEYDISVVLCTHVHYYGQALPNLNLEVNSRISTGIYLHGQELKSCFSGKKLVQAIHERFIQRTRSHRSEIFEAIRKSDSLFCNSAMTRSLVKKIRGVGQVDIVGCGVPNVIAQAYLSKKVAVSDIANRDLAREAFDLPSDVNIIGSIGRLVPHKNIQVLIQSLKKCSANTHALICGEGPEKDNLMALAEQRGLSDRVHFRSAHSESEKWRLMESLDQFVLLSKDDNNGNMEGFGIVLLEAMIVGVPVICSGSGGMTDIVEDRKTGRILRENTPEMLAKVSTELFGDEPAIMNLTVNARKRVVDHFLWPQVCQRMLNVAQWDRYCSVDTGANQDTEEVWL